MPTLHLVCGLPAVGKTTFGRQLAAEVGAAFLDSDTASDLLIQAAHRAAGRDSHDRDSPMYKATYRLPVYDTLFCLAEDNLPHTDVVIAGPFTTEVRDIAGWKKALQKRFPSAEIQVHHLTLTEAERMERLRLRGAPRDAGKLR